MAKISKSVKQYHFHRTLTNFSFKSNQGMLFLVILLKCVFVNSQDPCEKLSGVWVGQYGFTTPELCTWNVQADTYYNSNTSQYQMILSLNKELPLADKEAGNKEQPNTCQWWPSTILVQGSCTNATIIAKLYGATMSGSVISRIVMNGPQTNWMDLSRKTARANVNEPNSCSELEGNSFSGHWSVFSSDYCIWQSTTTPDAYGEQVQIVVNYVYKNEENGNSDPNSCTKSGHLDGSGTCSNGIIDVTFEGKSYYGSIMSKRLFIIGGVTNSFMKAP